MIQGKDFIAVDKGVKITRQGIVVDGKLIIPVKELVPTRNDPLAIALAVVGFGILGIKAGYLIARLLKQ